MDNSVRRPLARFAHSELNAIRNLLGLPSVSVAPSSGADSTTALLREHLQRAPEEGALATADGFSAAIGQLATWSWYRFAVSNAVNFKFLDDLLKQSDSALGEELRLRLEELRGAMEQVAGRLEGGWVVIRFGDGNPEIKKAMQNEIATRLREITVALLDVAELILSKGRSPAAD